MPGNHCADYLRYVLRETAKGFAKGRTCSLGCRCRTATCYNGHLVPGET